MIDRATIRRLLALWFQHRAKPHARRVESIKARIENARKSHKAWRPLQSQLIAARNAQLAAELGRTWRR